MGISLSEALAELRRELYAAQADASQQQFRFEVEKAELSLELEFRQEDNGGVKVEVNAWAAKGGAEAGGALGRTSRQTLTLTLQVRDEAVGGERARVRRPVGGPALPEDDPPQPSPGARRPDDGDIRADMADGHRRPWEG
ncbi:trypco2 family protein [Streptomyces sp. NPDC057424]|uniref:trypco2 family protein n=1 Tax=Streptomyces sp. NPDC057424 TaxID=3346127 RepID=UPI00367BD5A7